MIHITFYICRDTFISVISCHLQNHPMNIENSFLGLGRQCVTGPKSCVELRQSRWSQISGFGEARQGQMESGQWLLSTVDSGLPDFCTESFLGGCNVGIVKKGETRAIILHPSALEAVTVNES